MFHFSISDLTICFLNALTNLSILSMISIKLLSVINQQTGSGHKETWGDAYAGGGTDVELNLTFDNAATGKALVITLNGLSFADHSVTGLEPVEPIFEELNWQAKTCKVTADIA